MANKLTIVQTKKKKTQPTITGGTRLRQTIDVWKR